MNILALRSPSIINNLSTAISPCLPIGLAYIVASIKDLAHIEAIDPIAEKPQTGDVVPFKNGTSILGLTPEEVLKKVTITPDVCLVSSMFSMEWPVTKILIEELRKRFPESLIVGGGEHFTAAPIYSLENSPLDVCVLGEGEATIREFILRLKNEGKVPQDVPGTVVKDRATGKITNNPKRARIQTLEKIPLPAWEYFKVDEFLNRGISNTSNGGKTGYRAFPITASRGCPYQCTFCSNPSMWGTNWKVRPARDVVNEIKRWIGKYRVNHFDFSDLTAIVKKEWIKEFCEILIQENLNITWGLPSGTRSEALDEEVLRLMKQSGCNDIDYAPESGSEAVLTMMKKRINKENMLKSMRDCHKVGIVSKANIIFGHPDETFRHILETVAFIIKMAIAGVDDVLVCAFSPYPGSELFNRLQKEGKILVTEDYFLNLSSQGSINVSPSFSNHYGKRRLYLIKMGAFSIFYLTALLIRPKRLWVLIRDLVTFKGTTRLSMALINIVKRQINRFPITKSAMQN